MQSDEPFPAIGLDRRDALDLPAAGENVLGAALADELEYVHRHDIVRARDNGHRREIAGRGFRERRTARTEKNRNRKEQAKARTHADIVRPGLASPRVC